MIRALEVEAREGLTIWLRFSDGSAGEVDLSDLAGRGVFQAWDRGGVFESVRIAPHGAVAWNEEIELLPGRPLPCTDGQVGGRGVSRASD